MFIHRRRPKLLRKGETQLGNSPKRLSRQRYETGARFSPLISPSPKNESNNHYCIIVIQARLVVGLKIVIISLIYRPELSLTNLI